MALILRLTILVILADVVFMLGSRWLFPFDYGDQAMLKLEPVKALHTGDEHRYTPLQSVVTQSDVRYVCVMTSYTTSMPEKDAAFEVEIRKADKLPPGEEGHTLFAFFDGARKLISTAHWPPHDEAFATATSMPGLLENHLDGSRCIHVNDGEVESLVKDGVFYFTILEGR